MPEERLRLNWRELPSGSDILGRLQKLLTTLDSTGELHMELVRCKAKNIIAQVQINMGQKAVIRFSKMTVKRFSSNKVSLLPNIIIGKVVTKCQKAVLRKTCACHQVLGTTHWHAGRSQI